MKTQISDTKREEIVSKLQQDIDAANAYYEETVEPKIIERYQIYNADKAFYAKMFPKLSKRCELVSTDVQDTIESTMPSLMKTFHGSTDVVTIQGADGTDADDARAEKMQELINYQLQLNHSFMVDYQWMKDALITNGGIVKVDWVREYKPTQQTITLDADAYAQYRPQADAAGIKVIAAQPVPGGFSVTIEKQEMSKNQPRIMNVLASEFRFSPDATALADADFVAHRKIVTLDYLRKQQESGMYSHVDELTEKGTNPHYTTLDEQNNENIDDEPNKSDSGRRKVELYECYVNINMSEDPDAKLTPMIITVSNGVILRMEENTYERNPFFMLCPRIDPHKIWPETGFVDLIAQLQHSKTAILRQMIYNIALGNDSQKAINTSMLVDINDITEGKSVIRVNGNVNEAIQNIPAAPLQSWTFDMLEYLDQAKENRTGITKYNQGMDSNSLNKTATGINIITQQANQRLELIARVFAETGISDLYRFLIKLNQLFINEATVIRLTNGPMKIDPTDMDGNFDLVVNAGMGAGAKQTNLQNLQLIQQIVTQLAGVGMAGPEQFYNLAKRMIEEVGFKNTDDFVLSPDKIPPKPQTEDKVSESVRSDIDSAPWQIKAQYWQKQGYQVTPDMFTEQAATDALKTAVDAHAKADAARGNMNGTGAGNKVPPASAGRNTGAGVPNVSQADTSGDAGYGSQQDGAGSPGPQFAGPSTGLQSGYSGMS